MRDSFVRVADRVSAWMGLCAGFIILALVFSNVYAVIMRYIFNDPLNWPIDVSEMLLVGAVFLGGAYTLNVDGHVSISIFVSKFSRRKRYILSLTWYILISIFALVLLWKSTELAYINFYTRSWSITRLPLFPSYAVVPLGSLLLLAQSLSKLVKASKSK